MCFDVCGTVIERIALNMKPAKIKNIGMAADYFLGFIFNFGFLVSK